MSRRNGKMGILVGGGPAPGINSVIAAATIRAALKGFDVIGIHGGFRSIMRGDTSQVEHLTIEAVSRIHFRGGSKIYTARDNPTTDPKYIRNTLDSLQKLGIDKLITIGGDDTAYSALTIEKASGGSLRVVHVPKTIDNDLDLPNGIDTFGYQTARHVGVDLVKNLMIDARTTGRWYIVVSMGRKAGHLALGIGKAAGAPLTIIPEEFDAPVIPMRRIIDVVVATMLNRLAAGRADGIAILAEGLMERLSPEELTELQTAGRDEHGHLKMAEIQFAHAIRRKIDERLAELGVAIKTTPKDIGYELRCAEPIPFDMEYTRDLGFCAAQFVINGGTGAMVSIQNGHFKPLYFRDILDPHSGRTRVRMVDIGSEYYFIARRYMLRPTYEDFANEERVENMAKICGMSPEQFRAEFEYTVADDLLVHLQKQKKPKVEDVTTSI